MSTTTAAPTTVGGNHRTTAQEAEQPAARRSPCSPGSSAILFFVPVAWMVLTSLHSEQDAATNPPSVFAPLTRRATRSSSAPRPVPARGRR